MRRAGLRRLVCYSGTGDCRVPSGTRGPAPLRRVRRPAARHRDSMKTATDRPERVESLPPQEFFLPADKETEAAMNLLVAYVGILFVAQALSVGVGLIVDRLHSSHGGLIVFI